MKKAFLLASMICGCMTLGGQTALATEPVKASIGADLVSGYLWRGSRLDGVSIQPSVTLDWGDFSIGAWGSTGLTGDYNEVDWVLSWNIGNFSIGLTDYYCASMMDKYFDFSSDTFHVEEVTLGYDFGPVALSWNTNFLGAMGENASGKKSYSSYVEANAPFSLGGLEWNAALAVSPWGNSFYGVDKFSVVNCSLTASKDIEIGSVTVPSFVQLMANPSTGGVFLCAGISF